jgi:2'-deoxynucleoside 5'-phosphate N-hydrolase
MNIYFACSITGGRDFEPVYQAIVAALEERGHIIPTSHLASSEVIGLEKVVSAEDVYSRDIQWIDEAEVLVAEVSTPSHGVGYEIAYALSIGKPVLCLYQAGCRVSKMITGNTHPNISIQVYSTEQEAVGVVLNHLSQISMRL